jgi:hypothetical protein
MRLNFEMAQIERMSDGVVLLDKQAGVKGFNSAARVWLEECAGLTERLRTLIRRERGGLQALPATVKFEGFWNEESLLPVEAWLCKDGRADYVLLIARPSLEQTFKSSETRFVALLGEQARQEIKQLGDLLRNAASPGKIDRSAIIDQSARVDRILIEIDQLAVLFQRDKVFLDDRLSLVTLIKDILPALPHQRGEHAIHYKLVETLNQLGALYGDAAWLKYAIQSLLTGLGESAPPHSQVVLELRQLGDFIVFTGGVHAARELRQSNDDRRNKEATPPVERDIRLLMCQRIVQLHGGRLKVSVSTSNGPDEHSTGIESFTLNLLTGMPDHDRSRISCADCRYTLQAQAYAQDLSALLAEKSKQTSTGVSSHD